MKVKNSMVVNLFLIGLTFLNCFSFILGRQVSPLGLNVGTNARNVSEHKFSKNLRLIKNTKKKIDILIES